jgi:S1-C subfamily serine protease
MLGKVLLGCAVLLASDRGLNAQSALDPGTLYKQASPAVVIIEVSGSDGKLAKTGSGLLVSADGRLLTNYHVISHSKQATVKLANGDAYDLIEVIAIDKRKDIAFLKIPAVDLPFVKLGRSNAVEIGHTVYSIGSPLGLQNTLSQGLVSGIREMDGYRLFQISAPISQGSSGGPVFNVNGEVIGIAVLTIEGGQNLNFAIPIDYARGMLGMSQTQPLASIYEPEPPPDSKAGPQLEEAKMPATSAVVIPDEMRKGAFGFLELKMGAWKLDDARHVLGDPQALEQPIWPRADVRDAVAGWTSKHG